MQTQVENMLATSVGAPPGWITGDLHLTSHLDPRWLPGLAQHPITAQRPLAVRDSSKQPGGGDVVEL